jgi:hypothetical protein
VDRSFEQTARDRAILIVRLATFGGVASALGLSWLFSNMAEAYFSGKPPAPTAAAPPEVPVAAAPVQKAPTVVQKVVHHSGWPPGTAGSGPRPPNQGPGAALLAPPRPVCHSTPSAPC